MIFHSREELKRHYDEISRRLWSAGTPEPPATRPIVIPVQPPPPPEPEVIKFTPLPIAVPRINFNDVLDVVASELGMAPAMICARRRNNAIVTARHLMWALARQKCTHLSLPIIGRLTGNFDHSSVLNGARNGEKHEAFERTSKRLDDILAERIASRVEERSDGSV